jgi:FtsP/CotA-like multicopper oxidase with cupredoxin domain
MMGGFSMNKSNMYWRLLLVALLVAVSPISQAHAFIDGLHGTSFQFTAKAGHITAGDGASLLFWGFADSSPTGSGVVQYPGPTLILNEGDTVTITLANQLAEPVSMVFPGMTMISSTVPVFKGGSKANLTSLAPEAVPNGNQTYVFKAAKPGTFYYESGSNQPIQLRMGLFGAIIVRPATYKNGFNGAAMHNKVTFGLYSGASAAQRDPQVRLNYNDSTGIGGVAYTPSNTDDLTTAYDREYLLLGSEMDPDFQKWMEFGGTYDLSKWKSNYWFFNGRNAPDTMGMPNAAVLPSQPYNAMPLQHPGERVLVRLVDMGQEFHPFHHHGNHSRVIAVDGNLLSSNPATSGADLAWLAFTETMMPGKTMDTIYTWSGANLGWDIYADTTRIRPYEYLADHGKMYQPNILPAQPQTTPPVPTPAPKLPPQGVPVILPTIEQIIAGANYSGSPYLGLSAPLTPGEGGFNPLNGYFYMFHSHAELEITNNNTFPGGMLTMMGIIPWPDPTLGVLDNLDATDMYKLP